MERIASFCVDHTRLLPGMYLSRQDGADGEILTWDIRMKQPNKGSYLSPAAAHTLEHLFATYARNSKYSRGVVYVGPMGCLTGFYLLTTGLTPAEALDLTRSAFAWMAEFADWYDDTPQKKGISKFLVRLEVDEGAEVKIYARYDSLGDWDLMDHLEANVKRSYILPIVPRRADHYRLKFEGTGGCRIYSLAREFYEGSALRSTSGRQ
mgnify:CR=1 FL=1